MARLIPLLLALAAALVVFAVFPNGLIPLNDAFGYVRSIALTVEHGRPWTDGWLEPWSAGFSGLGALVFTATGSMYLATYGVCAGLMGVAAWACFQLLAARDVSGPLACAVTVILLFFPTVLWKFLEINGFSLYFTCLLLALLGYERKNWLGFTLAWCVALSTRQSAVAWGVLPAYATVNALLKRSPVGSAVVLRPMIATLVATGFFLCMTKFMNKTHAQNVITDQLLTRWSVQGSVRPLPVTLLTMGVAVGLGSIVLGSRRHGETARWRRALAGSIAIVLLIAGLGWDLRFKTDFDHSAFQVPVFYGYLKCLCFLGGVGVALGVRSVRPDFLLAALGCTSLLMLRQGSWDYYLADVAVFGFFAAPGAARGSEKSRLLPYVCTTLAVMSLSFVVFFKMRYDREYIVDTLGARALQRGAIDWGDASFLPFGAMGWYYFPYYSTHEGKTSANLAGFDRYLRRDVYGVAFRFPRLLRTFAAFRGTLPDDRTTVIEQERFSYCWFFRVDAALVRLPTSFNRTAASPWPSHAVPPILPLTDADWREQLKR
ncbi:MAG: hypothetical protein ABI222_17185 [Opitutaceae bacterium]